MPNKTIYVREADAELWEKAEKLAGGSLSGLITEAVRRYTEEEERKEQTKMETIETVEPIEVELAGRRGRDWEATAYKAQFVGEWLLDPDPDGTRTGEPGYDAGAYYGVALTERGNIAVYTRHVNDGFAPTLNVYDTFETAEESGEPADILATAANAMGADYVRKLDI